MSFKVGDIVQYRGEEYPILEVRKGGKTNTPNFHAGVLHTGYKSKPKTYRLTDTLFVRGSKLTKLHKTIEIWEI